MYEVTGIRGKLPDVSKGKTLPVREKREQTPKTRFWLKFILHNIQILRRSRIRFLTV